ncbi:MAG: Holliday junction branch migration protein RuvA [Rikenellaceae bacterium]
MYEFISGTIADLAPTQVVIETAGVGYLINISLETYSAIENSEQAKLYIHFVVREDAQIFYGFATKQERELFRMLISVSGVGGNTARMVLSTYSPRELQSIISTENAVLLKNVKGLGLKTAQKIIVELTGKINSIGHADPHEVIAVANNQVSSEALEALTMLGFPKAASEKSIKAILKQSPEVNVEALIRLALKQL